MIAVSFCSIARLTHCAQMKKLMWLLKTAASQPPLCEEKTAGCVVCHKHMTSLLTQRRKRTCRICQASVCSTCSDLSFISVKTGLVVQRTMDFCRVCIETANQTSAVDIMANESKSEDYLLDDSTEEAPLVSDGGLVSITDEFDRLSMVSTSSTSSFRIETPSSMQYHTSRKNTIPSWML